MTVSVGESASVDVSPYFDAPDENALSYTASSSNDAAVGASASGASVAVTAHARSVVTVTVEARDPRGLIAQQRFQVTVPNRGPEAADEIPVQTVFAGQTATVDAAAYFHDPDGDPLRYTATSSRTEVATVAVSEAEIAIRGLAPGVAMVTVRASDADGASAERVFQVTVPNRAPEPAGTIPPLTLAAGDTVTVNVSAYFTDPDGESRRGHGLRVRQRRDRAGGGGGRRHRDDHGQRPPGGLSASTAFGVSVVSVRSGFEIE